MQRIIITAVIALFCLAAMAQEDRKVAIFDPAGNVDNSIREIVREEISSIIVNVGGYMVLERQLIDRVLAENRFQQGGLVDDSQASEMGRIMGANLVIVTSITMLGANYHISCKLIDVETARIERQRTVQTQRGTGDLIIVAQSMVREMFAGVQDFGQSAEQDKKVAVFDPAGSVDNLVREIAREEISSIIVNAGGYTVLERQLIDRVLAENRFQQGGLVDDSQASEMGRLMGANYVLVSSLTRLGDNYHISCKMIDVETARIERQRTSITQRGTNDLIAVIQTMMREMFPTVAAAPVMPAMPAATPAPPPTVPVAAQTFATRFGARINGEVINPDGIELVYVEGNVIEFEYVEETSGVVSYLQDFYIGKYEVTQGQWQAIMGNNPSSIRRGDNLPVTNVSWDDVQVFIARLNSETGKYYRLPTQAEWEFAARGGTMSRGYMYSGSNKIGDVAWVSGNSNGVKQVGTKRPNELGIHDMSGNVWEWCHDNISGSTRRWLRGGSYNDLRKWGKAARRISRNMYTRYKSYGFRLVLDVFSETSIQGQLPRIIEEQAVPMPVADPNMLTTRGRNVIQHGKVLPREEVRKLMADTNEALQLYNKGIKRNRNGNAWMICGGVIAAGGAFVATAQPFEFREDFYRDNNHYYRYNDYLNVGIGALIAGAGGVMFITGAIVKGTSKKFVRQSANAYNGQKNASTFEWQFDFTGNGVRLALNF